MRVQRLLNEKLGSRDCSKSRAVVVSNDTWVVRTVVLGLLLVAITGMVGIVALTLTDHQAPDSFITLTGTALGALATFLVSTRTSSGAPSSGGE